MAKGDAAGGEDWCIGVGRKGGLGRCHGMRRGASAVGATRADAAGGRRSRGGGGGEEVRGPPEADDVAEARGRDVQSLSMCRPWQWTQSRMWGVNSLIRVFMRVRVVSWRPLPARAPWSAEMVQWPPLGAWWKMLHGPAATRVGPAGPLPAAGGR